MSKNRMEAFSDGVLAITLTVLKFSLPHDADFKSLHGGESILTWPKHHPGTPKGDEL
jgi:uncharacterized membrane protein